MNTTFGTLKTTAIVPALLFVSAFLSVPAKAQILGFSDNFNGSSTTYTDSFRVAGDGAAAGFTWGAATGTGGTGGLTVTNTVSNNLFYRPTPPSNTTSTFDFTSLAAGTTLTATTDFLWSNTTATDLTVLNAGFTGANLVAGEINSASSSSGSLIRTAGGSTVTLRMRNNGGNTATLDFNQSTLTAGSWYQLSFDLTKSATLNQFSYTVSLYSIGATGTSTPVLFNDGIKDITLSGTFTNAAIYGESSAFFAYDIRNTNGISQVDNFIVVPEPSTWALLAGAGTFVMILRRRRSCDS